MKKLFKSDPFLFCAALLSLLLAVWATWAWGENRIEVIDLDKNDKIRFIITDERTFEVETKSIENRLKALEERVKKLEDSQIKWRSGSSPWPEDGRIYIETLPE